MKSARVVLVAIACAALGFGLRPPKPAAAQISQVRKTRGRQEGIQVHGHWVLEIRNPDGSVAQRKEFENSLTPPSGLATNGAGILAPLLAGATTAGPWAVGVTVGSVNAFPVYTQQTLVAAQVANACNQLNLQLTTYGPNAITGGQTCAPSLTLGSASGQFTLQGVTPLSGATGPISGVFTWVFSCPSTSTVAVCLGGSYFGAPGYSYGSLTSTAPSGLNIQIGQDVALTVTIGFS
jgi:hypothetical protein